MSFLPLTLPQRKLLGPLDGIPGGVKPNISPSLHSEREWLCGVASSLSGPRWGPRKLQEIHSGRTMEQIVAVTLSNGRPPPILFIKSLCSGFSVDIPTDQF